MTENETLKQKLSNLQKKYDHREWQLRPWLYETVKDHVPTEFNEPLPKLIEKLQKYVE
mgnify:CR=1 FL=1